MGYTEISCASNYQSFVISQGQKTSKAHIHIFVNPEVFVSPIITAGFSFPVESDIGMELKMKFAPSMK